MSSSVYLLASKTLALVSAMLLPANKGPQLGRCESAMLKPNGVGPEVALRQRRLPIETDPQLEEITDTEPSVPGGRFFRRGTYYLGESCSSYLSSIDVDLSIGGLSNCTATVVVNLDTGLYLAHHSSTTLAKKENIAKLGSGRLRAIVISPVGLVMDAEYLQRQGIETDFFDIPNASSHVHVRYDGRLKEVVFSWRDKDGRDYLYRWRP